jgi:hypothetical protein
MTVTPTSPTCAKPRSFARLGTLMSARLLFDLRNLYDFEQTARRSVEDLR